jgi:WD repeat-containing protein 68
MNEENLCRSALINQEFPSTKLMWSPSRNNQNLLASSSDVIRLYKYTDDNELELNLTLHNKKSKYCAPLTSFDWNKENNSILGTASIDTTCTIWDLNKSTIRTQLIAHDKEVFDIAFSQDEHIFISTGADGSIRLFDLRSLDHSTIIYESKDQTPITKIAWNMQNNHFISALAWEKDTVYIIDSRRQMMSLVELKSHTGPITGMAWAPQSNSHICSVGLDKNALIWNIQSQLENSNSGPYLSYNAPDEINNVAWCGLHTEWIGIVFNNQIQLLRV